MEPYKDHPTLSYGLLRHGETSWNHEKRLQGQGNSPLTKKGKQQITTWAKQLATGNWQHILCSDLGRVQETVAILNITLNLPVTVDKRLAEQSWGKWEGQKISDIRRDWAEELSIQASQGWNFCPPEGETREEVRNRAFNALRDSQNTITAENLLVVCHQGVIKCLLYSIAGRNFMEDEPPLIRKGCMHTIHYYAQNYRIGNLNIAPGDTVL